MRNGYDRKNNETDVVCSMILTNLHLFDSWLSIWWAKRTILNFPPTAIMDEHRHQMCKSEAVANESIEPTAHAHCAKDWSILNNACIGWTHQIVIYQHVSLDDTGLISGVKKTRGAPSAATILTLVAAWQVIVLMTVIPSSGIREGY